MDNTSATGGFLLPTSSPLEGQALNRFLQQWISGVSGLPGDLVRVTRQTEPPNVPSAGNVWAAFTVGVQESDEFPFVGYTPAVAGGAYTQIRHEQIEMLGSFYDLGSNGLADHYARQFRDGALIAQNREYLTNAGFGLVRCGRATPAPSLLSQRWQYRVDVEFALRRQITKTYDVETLESATGDIYTDVGLPPQPY